MKLRFPVSRSRHVTIISAYAPTLSSCDEDKETFCKNLDSLMKSTPASDKLVVLGDFNARVGADHQGWKVVLGPQGVGKMNSNGLLLLTMCAENSLTITNTLFRLANKHKTTWMHPRSKQWHLIDYVIVRRQNTCDVTITRAMRGAECWTDHRLVRTVPNLYIATVQRRKPKAAGKGFDISKLKHPYTRERFQSELEEALTAQGPLTGDPTEQWNWFKQTMMESARATLGPKKRTHQDWFDENNEEIGNLLDEKHTTYINWQNDPSSASKKDCFKHLQSKVQKELRAMQDSWWDKKADEVQYYADRKYSKKFFTSLKTVYGLQRPSTTPLLAADSITLLKDKDNITQRWKEHFSTLLNRSSTVDLSGLNVIPEKPALEELDLPPSLEEITKAVKQMSSGKAPGMDGIPAEFYKAAGPMALDTFYGILSCIWKEETMPHDFRDATVVSLYKKKGNKSDCGNYRGISLLSTAGKILAQVILNRLISAVSEESLPESQCGFRPGRSTIDMVFSVRQIQEKCIKQRMDFYAVFIDLTKAFETVNREALWVILSKLGCPQKLTRIIRLFHDGMVGHVLAGGDTSAPLQDLQ